MCGINGIYNFKKNINSQDLCQKLREMNAKIIYRGPDHEGIFEYENLVMGMRRLAIIDLNSGNQPIFNEDKTLSIVYNGEIYNYQKLKEELKQKKHHFYTNTDTEVILHIYEEYGIDGFKNLDGMFAFSIFDKKTRRLILARDCMGEKPLYYAKLSNSFLWASELKSILCTELATKEINLTALNQYLQLTYIPAPLTIYKDIYKLQPGHALIVNEYGDIENVEYWCLGKQNSVIRELSYKKAKAELKQLVTKSVKERMISDVPLGGFLSGGIDSGTVVGIMAQLSPDPIKTFTIGFKEKEYDERSRARRVAKLNKSNHHEYVIEYNDVLNAVDDILEKIDEPFADPSILPTFFVSHFASKYVKVVLTGDAGDELFLGYNKYLINYYSDLYNKLPNFIKKIIEKIFLTLPDQTPFTRKVRKVLYNVDKDIFEQRMSLMSLGFKEHERVQLLNKEYFCQDSMSFLKDNYLELKNASEWGKTQYVDLKIVLEGDMLAKVDRMSMLNSLETRVPLLSKDIVEFAFSLPDEYKIKGKKLKRIMKDTFADILPRNFCNMKKSGFEIPLDYWFRNQMKDMLEQLFEKNTIEKQGIFNYSYIQQILQEHYEQKKNRKNEIWTLYIFQMWYYKYHCPI